MFYFFDKPSTALEFTSLERPFGTKVKRTVSLDIERDSGTLFAITRKQGTAENLLRADTIKAHMS